MTSEVPIAGHPQGPLHFIRTKLKPHVPQPVWRAGSAIVTYARRMRNWTEVLQHIRGLESRDRRNLRRSAISAMASGWTDLQQWQDPVLLEDARVVVRGIGQFNVRARSDDLYHVLPTREPGVLGAIKALLRPGALFVDAGANIGFYTVVASQLVGAGGKVVAVEMMPDTAAKLADHVSLNDLPNVEIHQCALSAKAGEKVTATVSQGKFGQASIAGPSGSAGVSISVTTNTLDAVLADRDVALLKLDLERAEQEALLGAKSVLKRIRAIIFEELPGAPPVAHLLRGAGYAIEPLGGSNYLARRPVN